MAEVMESETERIDAFKETLRDLKVNSKPLISMLTMLAESEKDYPTAAAGIVKAIEERLHEVRSKDKLSPLEIPVLYLIDSIVKNVGGIYIKLFTQNIVSNFCRIFERSDEKVRSSLYKLRCTWKGYFSPEKLTALDTKVKVLDPKWPILNSGSAINNTNSPSNLSTNGSADVSNSPVTHQVGVWLSHALPKSTPILPQVHINPNFIKNKGRMQPPKRVTLHSVVAPVTSSVSKQQMELERIEREKREMAERAARAEREAEILRKQLAAQELLKEEPKNRRKRGRQANNRQQSPGPSNARRARAPSPPPSSSSSQPSTLIPLSATGPLYTRRSEIDSYQNQNGSGYNGPVWAASGPTGLDQGYRTAHQEFGIQQPPVSVPQPISKIDPVSQIPSVSSSIQGSQNSQPLINVNELVSRIFNNNNKSAVVPSVANPTPPAPSLPPPSLTTVHQSNTATTNPPIVTPTTVLNPSIAAGSTSVPTSWLGVGGGVTKRKTPPKSTRGGATVAKHKQSTITSGANIADSKSSGPEAPLSWNNVESLKIIRPSLIEAIYDGRQCTSCPLRFLNSGKEYQSHLDWHFRQNKKKKGRGGTSGVLRRAWYYPFNLWLLFKEISDEDDSSGSLFNDGELRDGEGGSNSNSNDGVEDVPEPTVPADGDDSSPLNFCKVCGDKFESFFDQEEDAWLLRNAVKIDAGNCHPSCLTDLSVTIPEEAETSKTE